MKEIRIHTPYIELDQLLKWAGVAATGGEAKEFISAGRVLVNGERENRRGRKVRPGDSVEVDGRRYTVTSGKE